MSAWKEDPRLPYAFAALLGMIAGVAAKQAVAIQSGHLPKPITIFADFLVLGMVWVIVMYLHSWKPGIPLEGIALISAALAMWGPKGIALLLTRFQRAAAAQAEAIARGVLTPVEPIHRPTDPHGLDHDADLRCSDEKRFGVTSPIRKLRDVVPLKAEMPADQAILLAKVDRATDGTQPATDKGGPDAK